MMPNSFNYLTTLPLHCHIIFPSLPCPGEGSQLQPAGPGLHEGPLHHEEAQLSRLQPEERHPAFRGRDQAGVLGEEE